MNFTECMFSISDNLLWMPFVAGLGVSVILTIRSRFIQFRALPLMFRMFFASLSQKQQQDKSTVPAHKALFTAMSTSLGIGTMMGPIIAMGLGGPGSLAGFMLATIFGCATTFVEVYMALQYRRKNSDGSISGGPMSYLGLGLHPAFSLVYAFFACLLLIAWTTDQSNTIATMLKGHGISTWASGGLLAFASLFIVSGGIQRLAAINTKLAPLKFVLYAGATLFIIAQHFDRVPSAFALIFSSLFTPQAVGGAFAGFTVFQALRWGLARALQCNEAGVGTTTFPHSMSSSTSPLEQGILSMVAVYTNGLLCLLTGLVILVTDVYAEPGVAFDITMLIKIFSYHFNTVGVAILSLLIVLFAFGTTIGNTFNGSQCYTYLTSNRWLWAYQGVLAAAIVWGAVVEVKTAWTIVDFFILPVAIPHMIALVVLTFRHKDMFSITKLLQEQRAR